WRRCIHRIGRLGSIRSRRCAMNDVPTIPDTLAAAAPTTTSDPILFLHNIDRTYRQGEGVLEILKSAELHGWPRPSRALVAPSRTGKSTVLHVAGLLEQPDAGEVYIDRVATTRLSDAERTRIRRTDVGFVYQFHHLLPEFSAVENVVLPQMIRGLARAEATR